MIQRFYQWSTLSIELVCADLDQAEQIEQLWRNFFVITPTPCIAGKPALTLRYAQRAAAVMLPHLLTATYHDEQSIMWRTPDGLCLQTGPAWLTTAPGQAYGVIEPAFWCLPLNAQREFFLRSFLMILGEDDYYGLHANGVVGANGGLLFIGQSGSGKSTLTLSLIQAGWRYLGDDSLVLRQTPDGVAALTLQRGFACTQQTLAFFPQLQAAVTQAVDPVRGKQQVNLANVAPGQLAAGAKPHALLFPTIQATAASRLTPLTEAETLFRLIEQSAGLFIARRLAAKQMAVLRSLVRQAPGYHCVLGRDVYCDPSAVAMLLANL